MPKNRLETISLTPLTPSFLIRFFFSKLLISWLNVGILIDILFDIVEELIHELIVIIHSNEL